VTEIDSSRETGSSDDVPFKIEEVHQRVKNFVQQHIPNADLIRDFNGNFIYLVPNQRGFNPSKIYMLFENNKDRLYIADWGLC